MEPFTRPLNIYTVSRGTDYYTAQTCRSASYITFTENILYGVYTKVGQARIAGGPDVEHSQSASDRLGCSYTSIELRTGWKSGKGRSKTGGTGMYTSVQRRLSTRIYSVSEEGPTMRRRLGRCSIRVLMVLSCRILIETVLSVAKQRDSPRNPRRHHRQSQCQLP